MIVILNLELLGIDCTLHHKLLTICLGVSIIIASDVMSSHGTSVPFDPFYCKFEIFKVIGGYKGFFCQALKRVCVNLICNFFT